MSLSYQLKKSFVLVALSSAVAAFPLAALADVSVEIKTAETHAGFSAQATNIQEAHTHLHHTLNCLVGPGGNGFDKTALNPCNGNGNGIIPDTADATKKAALEQLAAEARAGLASNDLATVKKDAADIEAKLKSMSS
ncbi:MAG TPA: hypothetical protein VEH07_03640 [Alphaproteobacteria bacterium]|nr:hypothetical protein [Alphaproteobacteria bacterium]